MQYIMLYNFPHYYWNYPKLVSGPILSAAPLQVLTNSGYPLQENKPNNIFKNNYSNFIVTYSIKFVL